MSTYSFPDLFLDERLYEVDDGIDEWRYVDDVDFFQLNGISFLNEEKKTCFVFKIFKIKHFNP